MIQNHKSQETVSQMRRKATNTSNLFQVSRGHSEVRASIHGNIVCLLHIEGTQMLSSPNIEMPETALALDSNELMK